MINQEKEPILGGNYDGVPWRFYEQTELPDEEKVTAVACIATREKKVVLVHHAQRGWELPGGHREEMESIEESAQREVAEEACYRVGELEVFGVQEFRYEKQYRNYPFPLAYIVYFHAKLLDIDESSQASRGEIDEHGLFTLSELEELLVNDYQKVLVRRVLEKEEE